MNDLMAEAIPTTVEQPDAEAPAKATKALKTAQQQLVVHLPQETILALKKAAFEEKTTIRVVLLKALDKAGYPVPLDQLVDLRKA